MIRKCLTILLINVLILQCGAINLVFSKNVNYSEADANKYKSLIRSVYYLNSSLKNEIDSYKKLLDNCANNNYVFDVEKIDKICEEAIDCLKDESCLLKINGPLIIVGDIHGDIKSLEFCIKKFLKEMSFGKSILFLGDYVDRGKNSVECSVLLLKLKTMFPDKVYLLRGNHEIKKVKNEKSRERYASPKYGFLQEVRKKYNDDHVFVKLNEVFNYLSISAVVNDSVFCVHGGITPEMSSLNQLSELRKPISYESLCETKNKEKESLIMDLVWSDPSDVNHFKKNEKRGKGKLFGHKQVLNFLKTFSFNKIVRGHQCVDGYDDKFNDESIITVFSIPNYVGKTNRGGIINCDNTGNFSYEYIVY